MARDRDKYTASRSGRKGGRQKEARGVCVERVSEREIERGREAEQTYTYESKDINMKGVRSRQKRDALCVEHTRHIPYESKAGRH